MKRRQFIKLSATASAMALLPFELKAMLPNMNMSGCDLSNRKLVLINLAGGNDGLNTIIPLNDYDGYANLRPTLKISATGSGAYIPLDSSLADNQLVGLHPALTGFKSLYDQGWMRVIQSVGYPKQNKSHFASTDLYSTGNDGNSLNNGNDSGWIGRFMEQYYNNEVEEAYPLAVQIGSKKTSLGFHGEEEHGLAVNITGQDPAGFYTKLNGLGGDPPSSIPESDYGNMLQYIVDTDKLSNQYSQNISNAFNNGSNTVSYPNSDLANQLKTVARLISGGLPSKVYMVKIGGFDTHNNQQQGSNDHQGKHHDLLTKVSEAVQAFFTDIDSLSLSDDIVGLTYSEFGRKAKENGNLGTDHGEIAPMFVFGKPVNGGISGTNVDLSEANQSNNYQLKTVQYDYRQTIGTLLQNFLGADNTVIDGTFFNHTSNQSFTQEKIAELIKTTFSVPEECYGSTLGVDAIQPQDPNSKWLVYPNPFGEHLELHATLEDEKVAYALFDQRGTKVLQGKGDLVNGRMQIPAAQLAPGMYLLKLKSNSHTETHKVYKKR